MVWRISGSLVRNEYDRSHPAEPQQTQEVVLAPGPARSSAVEEHHRPLDLQQRGQAVTRAMSTLCFCPASEPVGSDVDALHPGLCSPSVARFNDAGRDRHYANGRCSQPKNVLVDRERVDERASRNTRKIPSRRASVSLRRDLGRPRRSLNRRQHRDDVDRLPAPFSPISP